MLDARETGVEEEEKRLESDRAELTERAKEIDKRNADSDRRVGELDKEQQKLDARVTAPPVLAWSVTEASFCRVCASRVRTSRRGKHRRTTGTAC